MAKMAAVAAFLTEDGEVIPFTLKGTIYGRSVIEAYNAERFQTSGRAA